MPDGAEPGAVSAVWPERAQPARWRAGSLPPRTKPPRSPPTWRQPGFASTGLDATGLPEAGLAATVLGVACLVTGTWRLAQLFGRRRHALVLIRLALTRLGRFRRCRCLPCHCRLCRLGGLGDGFATTRRGTAWLKAAASRPARAVPAVAFMPDTSNTSSFHALRSAGAIRWTGRHGQHQMPGLRSVPKDRHLGMSAAVARPARLPLPVMDNIASQGRYVMGGRAKTRSAPARAGTLPVEAVRCPLADSQGLPGLGDNNLALSALSFQSSASGGGSPLRVMFGQRAA